MKESQLPPRDFSCSREKRERERERERFRNAVWSPEYGIVLTICCQADRVTRQPECGRLLLRDEGGASPLGIVSAPARGAPSSALPSNCRLQRHLRRSSRSPPAGSLPAAGASRPPAYSVARGGAKPVEVSRSPRPGLAAVSLLAPGRRRRDIRFDPAGPSRPHNAYHLVPLQTPQP